MKSTFHYEQTLTPEMLDHRYDLIYRSRNELTLGGVPVRVAGAKLRFAHVRQIMPPFREATFAWKTIERAIEQGKDLKI